MRSALNRITIQGRELEYRLRQSKTAGKLRIRVGIEGIEVIRPRSRRHADVQAFLSANERWIVAQLDRMKRLQSVRRSSHLASDEILLMGVPTRVFVDSVARRERSNRVHYGEGQLVIVRGRRSQTTVTQSLENWLRKLARQTIEQRVSLLTGRLKLKAKRIYIMDQRTKWGNCSPLGNLSFSWRIIMAPDHVLRYLITHETVHLAVADHSRRFWLTVQSLCPEAERARQWLSANSQRLLVDLAAYPTGDFASKFDQSPAKVVASERA